MFKSEESLRTARLQRKLLVVYFLMFVLPAAYFLVCLFQLADSFQVPDGLMSPTKLGLLIGIPAAAAMSIAALLLLRPSFDRLRNAVDDAQSFLDEFETANIQPLQTGDETHLAAYYVSRIIHEFRRHVSALDHYAQQLYDANKELGRMSLIDPLTGLYNRRHATRVLDVEIQRAIKHQTPVSLLLVEVDGFESIIKTHGKRVGDCALRDFARLLSAGVRRIDLVAHDTGARFLVLLLETETVNALTAAERLRQAVAEHAFAQDEGGEAISLTVSTGIATLSEDIASVDEMIKAAETDLAVFKRTAENQTVAA